MNAKHKIEHPPSLTLAPVTEQRPASGSSVLLTPEQLAERLSVPPSWVREKTRARARLRDKDPLPVVRLGKYVRFVSEDVDAWVARQGR